jgi:hypothetical protein
MRRELQAGQDVILVETLWIKYDSALRSTEYSVLGTA